MLVMVSGVFFVAGLMMLVPPNDGCLDALAAILLTLFSWFGFYLMLKIGPESMDVFGSTISLAQLLVGIGSFITLLTSLYAVRRWNNHQINDCSD
ncbi:MAG: hypothetical protein AB8B96_13425 [Lysobacterales bacterium]